MLQRLRGKNQDGFTLIELMIVIAIIGILAAIAVPNFLAYRQRSYDTSANSDAKGMYTSAQAYFTDFPTSSVSLTAVSAYGYRSSADITATATGNQGGLTISTFHAQGTQNYSVDATGIITKYAR